MARRKRKDDEPDWVAPDFDEVGYTRRELEGARAAVATIGWAVIGALVAFALYSVLPVLAFFAGCMGRSHRTCKRRTTRPRLWSRVRTSVSVTGRKPTWAARTTRRSRGPLRSTTLRLSPSIRAATPQPLSPSTSWRHPSVPRGTACRTGGSTPLRSPRAGRSLPH